MLIYYYDFILILILISFKIIYFYKKNKKRFKNYAIKIETTLRNKDFNIKWIAR